MNGLTLGLAVMLMFVVGLMSTREPTPPTHSQARTIYGNYASVGPSGFVRHR